MKTSLDVRAGRALIRVPKTRPLELVQSAAHLLCDRAIAYVEEARGAHQVTLLAKDEKASRGALEALAADFLLALSNAALRARLAENNRAIMEYVIPRALVPALEGARAAPEEGAPQLSGEQREEIGRLIAEAEAEIAARSRKEDSDPLGIARTWEERNSR